MTDFERIETEKLLKYAKQQVAYFSRRPNLNLKIASWYQEDVKELTNKLKSN